MNEPNFSSEPEELTDEEAVINRWKNEWLVDFNSRTLRNDFSDVLAQLQKTDIHIRALEEVFRALIEIHCVYGMDEDKQYIKTMPRDVFAVLRGEEELELNIQNDFFVNLLEQMRNYYQLYLQWKWA